MTASGTKAEGCYPQLVDALIPQVHRCGECHGSNGINALNSEFPNLDQISLRARIGRPTYGFELFHQRVRDGYGLMTPMPGVCEGDLRRMYTLFGGNTQPAPEPPSRPTGGLNFDSQPDHPECIRWRRILEETQRKVAESRRRAQRDREIAKHNRRVRIAALADLGRNLKRHSFYQALTTSGCKSDQELRADGVANFSSRIERSCRMGNVRTTTVSRVTLSEALDPRQVPADRDPYNRSGGFGTGQISEPGRERGYPNLPKGRKVCVVPENRTGNKIVRYTCGNQDRTVTCPALTDFVKVRKMRTKVYFYCMRHGNWRRWRG